MRYAQYRPSPAFAAVVECYWFLEGTGAAEPQAILPDGRAEVIVHFGDRFERHHPGGAVERQDAAILVGQLVAPMRIACRGRAGVAAIRLRPAASRSLAGCPAAELTGRTIDLDAVAGGAAHGARGMSTATLRERLALARGDAARIDLLESWLRRRLRSVPPADVAAAVDAVLAAPAAAPLPRIAAGAGLGVRQLERRFTEHVGLAPKTFARIARLQRALSRIDAGASLAAAAQACGYYDQAHMARDFSRLAETSPSAWRASGADLTRLFVT